ncbi:MAG: thioredoxin [marine bacterium B5-7]|nr:MAG: thioredoxin [marine bacterium B5-7]
MAKKFVAVLFCLLLTACSQPAVNDLQGKAHRLSDFKNKILLVNVWAPWCAPCRKEVPLLNQFAKQHQATVAVIGLSFVTNKLPVLRQQAAKLNIRYPVLLHYPPKSWHLPAAAVLPTTIVFDKAGKVVKIIQGPVTKKQLNALIGRSRHPALVAGSPEQPRHPALDAGSPDSTMVLDGDSGSRPE